MWYDKQFVDRDKTVEYLVNVKKTIVNQFLKKFKLFKIYIYIGNLNVCDWQVVAR